VLEAGLACCGVEASALDLVLQADVIAGLSHNQARHILVVAGTVTHALAPVVKSAYDQLAEPKVVVAFGACAIGGGPYWDSYSVVAGADQIVSVDIHVPGCPPTPEDLARALEQASQLVGT
jgi:NADH-quinone oxidoreductase subunit B